MREQLQVAVVRLFLSRSGPLLVNLISALAAWISVQAAKHVPNIDQLLTPELIAGAVFLIASDVLSMLPTRVLKEYGKQIQTVLNDAGAHLKVDGVVLVKTAQAVENTVGPRK